MSDGEERKRPHQSFEYTPEESDGEGKNDTFKMTKDQEDHLQFIKNQFISLVDAKYRAGAATHKTDLRDLGLGLIDEAIAEMVDGFTYVISLRELVEISIGEYFNLISDYGRHQNQCSLVMHPQRLYMSPSTGCTCGFSHVSNVIEKHFMADSLLPDSAEVLRASGDYVCETCGRKLHRHKRYRYTMDDDSNTAVLGCDGVYYHL